MRLNGQIPVDWDQALTTFLVERTILPSCKVGCSQGTGFAVLSGGEVPQFDSHINCSILNCTLYTALFYQVLCPSVFPFTMGRLPPPARRQRIKSLLATEPASLIKLPHAYSYHSHLACSRCATVTLPRVPTAIARVDDRGAHKLDHKSQFRRRDTQHLMQYLRSLEPFISRITDMLRAAHSGTVGQQVCPVLLCPIWFGMIIFISTRSPRSRRS